MTGGRTEELKLVFALNEAIESIEVAVGAADVKFQPRTGSIGHLDALRLLIDRMREFGIDTTFIENGKTISAETLLTKIEKKGTWGHLETAELSLQYGVVGAYEHCFIAIQEKTPRSAGDWEQWAKSFIVLNGFVQGWVSDVEYNRWQNVKDPAEYEMAGRDFSRLPMKSNGLPPPVQRLEIDISKNPGRWALRLGYVEAIGSIMWLSESFWDRVGWVRKNHANLADWVRVSEPAKGIVEIRTSEHYFVSDETVDIQDRLRALLYG